MSNIKTNDPCICGSGKKYKKCCLRRSKPILPVKQSKEVLNKLNKPCWYHGTDQSFDGWVFPPPPKPNEASLVPHTAVFFTSDIGFAQAAGKNLCCSSLSSESKILDTTANYEAAEAIRKIVAKNEIAALTLNVTHDFWHSGWTTGDVLRIVHGSRTLENHLNGLEAQYVSQGLPEDAASFIVGQNLTRGFIELICISAKNLGFDALYGHEVDRHSYPDRVVAQPWLAVFNKAVMSSPEWL